MGAPDFVYSTSSRVKLPEPVIPAPDPLSTSSNTFIPRLLGPPQEASPFSDISSLSLYFALIAGTPDSGITLSPPHPYFIMNYSDSTYGPHGKDRGHLLHTRYEVWEGLAIDHLELQMEQAGTFFLTHFHDFPIDGKTFYTIRRGVKSNVGWHGWHDPTVSSSLLWAPVAIGPRPPPPVCPFFITVSPNGLSFEWSSRHASPCESEYEAVATALRELPLDCSTLSHSRFRLPCISLTPPPSPSTEDG